jgi:hypothetical protein
MTRLLRPMLTALAVLSLLLCAATLALWLRTELAAQVDFFDSISPATSYGLSTERGAIIFWLQLNRPWLRDGDPADAWKTGAGFRYVRITSSGMRRYNLVLPLWLLALATAAPPALWWLGRAKARRRFRRGLCPKCGYDLRATPDRCPECGAIPPESP